MKRRSGFSMVEMMVAMAIVIVLMGIGIAAINTSWRTNIKAKADDEVRRQAVLKMYEGKGLTTEDTWPTLVRAKLVRMGHPWPYDVAPYNDPTSPSFKPLTPPNLAAWLATQTPTYPELNNFKPDDWTSKQSVIDLGYAEPNIRDTLGVQGHD